MSENHHDHGGDVFAAARTLGLPYGQLIDFSASINPLGMAPGVREALAASMEELLHYPDRTSFRLRENLAAYHGVGADNVTVANGSTELIHLIPRALPGRRALIVAPAFSEYAAALTRCGWDYDHLTLPGSSGFSFSLEEVERALSRNYQLLFLCNPGNPTGALLSRDTIAAVLKLCRAHGTFLVLDEAFMDFCEEESAKGLFQGGEGGVVLRSMTKFFAIPGLRLGYAIGASSTIALLAERQDPWSVNTAAEVAGIASLSDAGYRERTRAYVIRERWRLTAGLAALPWLTVFPSQANYLLARIEGEGSATALRSKLMREGILIRDCSNFYGLDRRFFRVAVRRREENELLLEKLGALGI